MTREAVINAMAKSVKECLTRDGVGWKIDIRQSDIRAALLAAEACGWQLVPRCPDKHMIRAACKAMSPGRRPTPGRVSVARKHAIRWTAMIAASKQATGEE